MLVLSLHLVTNHPSYTSLVHKMESKRRVTVGNGFTHLEFQNSILDASALQDYMKTAVHKNSIAFSIYDIFVAYISN